MELTYSKHGDNDSPDLVLPNEEPATYGHFGRMRLNYLKEHRRATYITLKTTGQLTHYLNEIDREANEMLRRFIQQMAQAQGITEKMKEDDSMAWVGVMNNIRNAAEKQICHEVILVEGTCLR